MSKSKENIILMAVTASYSFASDSLSITEKVTDHLGKLTMSSW